MSGNYWLSEARHHLHNVRGYGPWYRPLQMRPDGKEAVATTYLQHLASKDDTTDRFLEEIQSLSTATRPDSAFRVVVPVSGGMDSMTCWKMATMAGLPVEAVFVDTGAAYIDDELIAVRRFCEPTVLTVPVTFSPDGFYDPGRNAIIVWLVAGWARDQGFWGDLWFGNQSGFSESPDRGGDKSSAFFLMQQALLTHTGYDMRIINPLLGMDKRDEINWWALRRMVATLATKTRSCHNPGLAQCGHCFACFRKWVAFAGFYELHGLSWKKSNLQCVTFPHGIDFSESVTRYRTERQRARSLPMWSDSRCQWVDDVLAAEGW